MSVSDQTYTITQLAREFGVTARALRFYEDKGLLSPRRDGLARIYSYRDRARLMLILRGKRVGLPLIEIKEILDLYTVDQRAQLQVAIKKYRARIADFEAQRADIDATIDMLHDYVARTEQLLENLAPSAQLGAARAFEEEARRRLEDAPEI